MKDRALRALAETENVRRRLEREREDVAKFAVSKFAQNLYCRLPTTSAAPSSRSPPRPAAAS